MEECIKMDNDFFKKLSEKFNSKRERFVEATPEDIAKVANVLKNTYKFTLEFNPNSGQGRKQISKPRGIWGLLVQNIDYDFKIRKTDKGEILLYVNADWDNINDGAGGARVRYILDGNKFVRY